MQLGSKESQIPAQAVLAFKLKRILVPVDFSDCSKKALQYAIPFAKQFDAELVLLHVIDVTPIAPEVGFVDAQGIPESREELLCLQKAIGKDVRSTTLIRTGAPYLQIAQTAVECQADLIIISTHGRKGLSRVVMGSTTERVVRHAHCPVLIVRQAEHEFIGA